MADARGRMAWALQSSLLALIYNRTAWSGKDKPRKPDDFNPYCRKPDIELTEDQFVKMMQGWCNGRVGIGR